MDLDNYILLLTGQAHRSPITFLSVFFLTLARLLPIISLSPFFGAKAIPVTAKILLGICLTMIVLPQNLLYSEKELSFSIEFMMLIFKELFIGLCIGYLASIPFFIVQGSGGLIDHMRGSSSLQVTDPSTQSQTGPLGILYNYVLILIFFSLNGPMLLINAIFSSYRLIPVDQWLNPGFFLITIPFWKLMISLFSYIMTLAIQLAAPSLVGVIMADMFLGIANRLAPNVQIVFLGIPIKSWLGIALLALAWGAIIQQMGQESLSWLKTIEDTLVPMAPKLK